MNAPTRRAARLTHDITDGRRLRRSVRLVVYDLRRFPVKSSPSLLVLLCSDVRRARSCAALLESSRANTPTAAAPSTDRRLTPVEYRVRSVVARGTLITKRPAVERREERFFSSVSVCFEILARRTRAVVRNAGRGRV